MNSNARPDTIVLVHGFWVTPRSWEHWIEFYQQQGYTVLAPAYPGFEVEVEALNADPAPIEELRVPAIIEKLESVITGLARRPIIVGHSAGGAFTHTFSDDESRALYQRYHIPASGRILWDSSLANLLPGHQDTWVNYHNDKRAPLLFISGGEDHLMPPAIQRSNAKHYKSHTLTEVVEYPGYAHLLPAQEGWEKIAQDALDWAVSHAGGPMPTPAGDP